VRLPTAVGPFQGILGPDTLMWARPNCLLGFPNGMSRPKHGEDHGAWNYPLVLGLLTIVFLGVTIYPKEVVRGDFLKCSNLHMKDCLQHFSHVYEKLEKK
jgi:hypothetical protein